MGIDSQLYQKSREAVGLAVNAQIAINRLIDDADPAISRELNAEMNEAGERLSRTSNNLLSEFRGVDGATEIIDDTRAEINEMLPVFMMHPGARYYTILEAIIGQLESAAQSDSGLAIGEQELLDRLRGHAIAFATATSIERALETVEEYLTKPECRMSFVWVTGQTQHNGKGSYEPTKAPEILSGAFVKFYAVNRHKLADQIGVENARYNCVPIDRRPSDEQRGF